MLKFWYTEQGIRRCFTDVTNRGLDCVCNACYPFMNDSILQTRPFTVDLMIPGRNYKVHGIDRNTSVLSAADCFLAQIQNTRVKITLQVLHCSNLAFCTLLLLFFFNLHFCVGVTAITKTNYNQNCMPIASLEFPIPPSDMYPSAHTHINTHITHTHAHNHNGARTNTCICVKISLKNNDKHVPINYTPSKPYLLHLIQQACQLLFRFAILLINW